MQVKSCAYMHVLEIVLCTYVYLCAQGVQAQTVANFLLAFEKGLSIIPVINKVRGQPLCVVPCNVCLLMYVFIVNPPTPSIL